MDATVFVGGLVLGLVVLGWVEWSAHRRRLRQIPIRIHINGTRGKSGVTRLVAAGLRAAGIRTCAKTTGTLARIILPDGREYPVFRPAGANVIEQLRIVKAAAAHDAEALVMECMALEPCLQSLCELRLVQATHGVITNVRPDHLDVMGPTGKDVALALAGTVPAAARLYTAASTHLDVLRTAAHERKTELVHIGPRQVAEVTPAELSGFSYIEHAENVALALALCADLGVDRQTALAGMWDAEPDAGVLSTLRVERSGMPMMFVNAFAANDPESTQTNWELALARFDEFVCRIAVFNCRDDRTDRSRQLAEACVDWPLADWYLVTGSGTGAFVAAARDAGLEQIVEAARIVCAEGQTGSELYQRIADLAAAPALVVGMGNIGGAGHELADAFGRAARAEEHLGAERIFKEVA